jgi:hypothetical protein
MDAMVGTALHEAGDVNELQELHLELIEQQDRPVSGLVASASHPRPDCRVRQAIQTGLSTRPP